VPPPLARSQKSVLQCIQCSCCNPLQHTATHCNTLQCTAMHCNALQPAASQKYNQRLSGVTHFRSVVLYSKFTHLHQQRCTVLELLSVMDTNRCEKNSEKRARDRKVALSLQEATGRKEHAIEIRNLFLKRQNISRFQQRYMR